jgi:predicted ATP-dependent endonuclease of OLD family
MKIKHVRIQNFRGIDDLSLDFGSDNINVLIGVNGVGKSSVIDCLCLLLSEYVKKLREVFRERKLQQSLESNYIIGNGSIINGNVSGDIIINNYDVLGSNNNIG